MYSMCGSASGAVGVACGVWAGLEVFLLWRARAHKVNPSNEKIIYMYRS